MVLTSFANTSPARSPSFSATHSTAPSDPSLASLYDRTVGRVYGLALAIVGDHAIAEEITEETYVAFWREKGPGGANDLPRLFAIARDRALTKNCPLAVTDLLDRLDPASPMYKVIAAHAPADRQVLALAFLRGMDARAIAAALGIALREVRAILSRVSTAIRAGA